MNNPTLAQTQHAMLSNIIDAQIEVTHYQNELFPAKQLLQVYQNNYISSLRSALKSTYSAVFRLVGEDFFNYMVNYYAKDNSPKTGNIQDYGHNFYQFIKTFKPCQSLPYLADIALLEYDYECCYYGQNVLFDIAENYPNFNQKKLSSSLDNIHILKSAYPIIAIWQLNEDSPPLDLQQTGDNVLLYKHNQKIKVLKLSQEVFDDLMNLKKRRKVCQWL